MTMTMLMAFANIPLVIIGVGLWLILAYQALESKRKDREQW